MVRGGFGDFSGAIQTHCSVSFLRCCIDDEPGSGCIDLSSNSQRKESHAERRTLKRGKILFLLVS